MVTMIACKHDKFTTKRYIFREVVHRETQINFTIINWGKQNRTNLHLERQNNLINYVNIDLRHQYEISGAEVQTSLLARCL